MAYRGAVHLVLTVACLSCGARSALFYGEREAEPVDASTPAQDSDSGIDLPDASFEGGAADVVDASVREDVAEASFLDVLDTAREDAAEASPLDAPEASASDASDASASDATDAENAEDAGDAADASVADVAPDVAIAPTCAVQTTTALATWSTGASDVAVDDTYVYFHGTDGVARVAKGGGLLEVLTTAKVYNPIVLRADTLDWASASSMSDSILTLPKSGGTPATLLTETTVGFVGLTPGPGDDLFFWGSSLQNNLLLQVTDSGVVTTTTSIAVNATDVETSDGFIYFTEEYGGVSYLDAQGMVHILGKGPGQVPVPSTIRFDEQTVYFVNFDYDTDGDAILSVPKAGGNVVSLASHPDSSEDYADMRVSGGSVYFTEGRSGLVWRMDPDGGNKTVIGASLANEGALGLAVDDRCVYWRGGTHIYAAPR